MRSSREIEEVVQSMNFVKLNKTTWVDTKQADRQTDRLTSRQRGTGSIQIDSE